MNKVCIAIPAYNEEKVISNVIHDVQKEGFKDIVVINDCSKDNTALVAKKAGAKVISHEINKGAGGATRTGLEYVKEKKYDFVVFLDADGQHSPKDIKKLLNQSSKYDVVIGSRLIDSKGMPLHRKMFNIFGSFVTWIFFGLYVRDSQSGFKVFNKKAINKIKITFDRYEFCSEIIGEIHKHRLKFKEVPIKVIYSGDSLRKGQNLGNGFLMLVRFLRRKFK